MQGDTQLQGANFGDLGRIESVLAGRKFYQEPTEISDWIALVTGQPKSTEEPCSTALQIRHLFRKFIRPQGEARRDELQMGALVAGKRYSDAAPAEECVEECVRNRYLDGPDYRGRYRRAGGDKYAEMVRFVRDSSVSDGLGQVIARLCRQSGCIHQLNP